LKLKNFIYLKFNPLNIIGLIKKLEFLLIFKIKSKNITIEYDISSDIYEWVLGYHIHLQHLLLNLLSNAVKFANPNSKIIIKVNSDGIINKEQKLNILIIDKNKHIDRDIKENLFQKYNTSDNVKGTGLGLYICKKIIELHNGTISHEYHINPIGNVFIIKILFKICTSSKRSLINSLYKNNKITFSTRKGSVISMSNSSYEYNYPRNSLNM